MTVSKQLDSTAIRSFADQLRGDLLQPGDDGYDAARTVWNGMIDKYPALVARCAGPADVKAAVGFARRHGRSLSVKGGGHNVAGRAVADDGLMLDLSLMNSVRVDPAGRVVQVGPGCTWGDVDHETQAFGLATTGGVDSRTGVAGLTLGGGWGWLARKHGMAVDNLSAVDVVTADGEYVHADAETNPDLFWGVRGGGGNFGIVTAFEYELHPVGPEVTTAQVFHPKANLAGALHHFRTFMTDAPDEVGAAAMALTIPPMAPFPEEHHGETAVGLVACYAGDRTEGKAVLDEFAAYGDPFISVVDAMPYTLFQQSFDDSLPRGERYYYKSQYLAEFPDEAIDTLVERCDSLPGAYTVVGLEAMGGAINRIPVDATAYPHRNAAFNLGIWAGWSDPDRDAEITAWARDLHGTMQSYSTGGVYANYLDQDDDDRVRGAVGDNFERLVEIKRDWDPTNVFDHNVPIDPETE